MPSLCVFSAHWRPTEGGAEKQLRQIAEELVVRGWQVDVIAGGEVATTDAPEYGLGVSVHRVPGGSGGGTGLKLTLGALRQCSRSTPDVVVGSLVSGASLAAGMMAQARALPMVLRLGGHDFDRLRTSRAGRIQGRFTVKASSLIVVNADHLASQVDSFQSGQPTPIITIRNGVPRVAHIVPDLPRQPGPLRAIYYTNAGRPKNDPDFVELVRSSPEIEFRAIGSTDHLPSLPNLQRRGWVSDVYAELTWADVAVNTSISEGSPNFCLQAIACGRSVVGFDNAGITELAQAYPSWVAVVRLGDVASLRSQLIDRDPALALRPPHVPSISDAATQWDQVLRDLIGETDPILRGNPHLRRSD